MHLPDFVVLHLLRHGKTSLGTLGLLKSQFVDGSGSLSFAGLAKDPLAPTPNFCQLGDPNPMTTTLSSLPLPPSIQLKLAAAGFTSVGDFDGLSAAELAEDLVVEPREAQKLLAQVRSSLEVQPRDLKTKSALQLLNEERASTPITTFVKELDNLLGGGVALGQLTGARLCQGAGGGWRVAGGGWRVAGGVRGGVWGARCARRMRAVRCGRCLGWCLLLHRLTRLARPAKPCPGCAHASDG